MSDLIAFDCDHEIQFLGLMQSDVSGQLPSKSGVFEERRCDRSCLLASDAQQIRTAYLLALQPRNRVICAESGSRLNDLQLLPSAEISYQVLS
jgi:hypothetical protein